eukprot:gene14896-20939_t
MSTSFSVPASSPVTDCSLDVMGNQLQEIAAILGIPLENITNECSMIDDSMRRALQQVLLCEEWTSQAGATLSAEIATQVGHL